jgi:hypothetical protein
VCVVVWRPALDVVQVTGAQLHTRHDGVQQRRLARARDAADDRAVLVQQLPEFAQSVRGGAVGCRAGRQHAHPGVFVDAVPARDGIRIEVGLAEHERRGNAFARGRREDAVDDVRLQSRLADARHGEHVRDVRRQHLRSFLAFARGAAVQLRTAGQHRVDR